MVHELDHANVLIIVQENTMKLRNAVQKTVQVCYYELLTVHAYLNRGKQIPRSMYSALANSALLSQFVEPISERIRTKQSVQIFNQNFKNFKYA